MPNGDLNDATHRSHDWMASCAELLEGVTFNTTSRARVSVALQHLCIEHHQGRTYWSTTACEVLPLLYTVRNSKRIRALIGISTAQRTLSWGFCSG